MRKSLCSSQSWELTNKMKREEYTNKQHECSHLWEIESTEDYRVNFRRFGINLRCKLCGLKADGLCYHDEYAVSEVDE